MNFKVLIIFSLYSKFQALFLFTCFLATFPLIVMRLVHFYEKGKFIFIINLMGNSQRFVKLIIKFLLTRRSN